MLALALGPLAPALGLLALASVLLALASAGKRNYGPHFSHYFQNGLEPELE
jgi:hypothetical protein